MLVERVRGEKCSSLILKKIFLDQKVKKEKISIRNGGIHIKLFTNAPVYFES